MRRIPSYLSKSALAVAITAGLTGNVQAEESSPALEEIVVTAQRKSESLQNAAIAINAASGKQLERLGVVNAEGLNKIAPALAVLSGGGANTAYFVRGVGNFTNNGYTNPAIAFNIDGVYIGRPSSTISSFLDLNRVEVLKGPQGTLYGRNSTGGAINVIPNTPMLGESNGNIKIGAGNYGAFDATLVTNFAVSENSAARLAATISERDGYFDDGTGDADDMAIRAQYYTEVNEKLLVRVAADYSTQQGAGAGVQYNGYYAFSAFNSDLPIANWDFVAAPDGLNDDFTGLHAPAVLNYVAENVAGAPAHSPFVGYIYPTRDDSYKGVNAEINYDLDWAELTIVPAYRVSELNNQFNGPPFKAAINQDKAEQTSVEARLAGSAGNVDWIFGAYYFDENVKGQNSFNQFSTVSHNDFDSNVESTAIFARGTYNVSDQLRLVAGVRYTDETRSIESEQSATAAVCLEHPEGRAPFCPQIPTLPVGLTLADTLSQLDPSLFPLRPLVGTPSGVYPFGPINVFASAGQFGPGAILSITPSSTSESGGDSETTYRAAIEYDVAPESLLYASFETGFRAGGFNLATGREVYEPEYIDAFTLGSKNRFMDGRLQLNAELFSWVYENQQLAALGTDINGANAFYTRNVGESSIKGAEVDFQFAATDSTLLRGSIQLLDATYDNYTYTQVDLSDDGIDPPNFLTPVNGCVNTQVLLQGDAVVAYNPALDGAQGYDRGFTVDCSGKDALNAPDLTATLGIQQMFEIGGYTIIGNLDARYRGERELGFGYQADARSDSDLTADLAFTLIPSSGNWSLNAYFLNLTNETIASTYQLGAGNVAASAYEPPRTYGLRFSYDF
ncbi:TonB-dependent receptor [Arenicella xantha]|uniref:Iron complex outermembrane receptor protein n=1 Tax=Arenicella xantha TaxID=644221 RepID=A0A395JF49_9GAMM|nr:TonB-dependent receptor [Arenicella xantha]RBP47188.1 iron complex outermembrane receptor protein [Arenicella xantha]